ncbi:MAG TPA: segregation/condensation protein A [Thermoanaerobaculia bacterium]|nr:segregation/condensation protein A [Thermoanaerobaculia bacterium]
MTLSTRATPGSLLPEAWRVHLPIFEGPLDLLLHLIKVSKVEITDIPVAQICDQFHDYLALMENLNLDVAAEFVYEAALLIHLKSRLLLPRPKSDSGEEEDPREELVKRLLEYRRLKEAAQSLAEVQHLRSGMWTRKPVPIEGEEPELDLSEVSLFDLLGAFRLALDRYDREHPPPMHVRAEVYSVRHELDRLIALLSPGRPFNLVDDLRTRSCRAEAIATFLAVLELARLQLVRLHATEAGDILLHRTTRELSAEDRETVQA